MCSETGVVYSLAATNSEPTTPIYLWLLLFALFAKKTDGLEQTYHDIRTKNSF